MSPIAVIAVFMQGTLGSFDFCSNEEAEEFLRIYQKLHPHSDSIVNAIILNLHREPA